LYFGAVIELGGRGGVATRGVLVWFDGKNLTKLGILSIFIFKKTSNSKTIYLPQIK
jgi:hypothetical protein